MELKDWITIVGWPVVFALGILSGGFIIPRLTRKRRILSWALVNQSEVVPRELSRILGIPVILKVGDAEPASLSLVTMRIGNSGNEVIEKIDLIAAFNTSAAVINVRTAVDLGEYKKHINWEIDKSKCNIRAAFINPGRSFELEFILSNYEAGAAEIDAAAPGLELRRLDPTRWEIPSSFLKGVGLNLIGLRYDPSAIATTRIAEELRSIRMLIGRQNR